MNLPHFIRGVKSSGSRRMTNPDKSLIVVFLVSAVQWEVTCPAVTYNNICHSTFTLLVHKLTAHVGMQRGRWWRFLTATATFQHFKARHNWKF